MKRLALTALALASTALSGAAFADDYYSNYNQGTRSGYQYNNGYESNGARYDSARVISVDPIIDQYYSQSRRECWVASSRNSRYGNRYSNNYNRRYNNNGIGNNTHAVLGGVLGAAIGNHVGSGDGRRAATAVGAVLGYAIARDAQNNRGDNYRYSNNAYDSRNDSYGNGYYTEPNGQLRCRMVNDDNYGYGYQNNRYDNSRDHRYGRDHYVNERYQDRYDHDRYDNRYDDARVTGYRVTFEYHGQTYTTTTDYHPGSNIRVRVNVEADGSRQVGYNSRDNGYSRY
ncbi:MAG: glycine zipper 2TM domain-containing protein [Arenimonas sp.]